MVSTSSWAIGTAGLVAALAGMLMFLVLTGAITRAVAAEVAGEDPGVEQNYLFWSRCPTGCWSGCCSTSTCGARNEQLTLERLRADLQASAA